ncbi:MAG: hypothetical protein RIQ89_906 [Bacteroidota bacterium]|jgi:DNA polymerase-3 subunit epsilon
MKLQLKRPLLFLDLETTGVNVGSDRIIEMAILKLHVDGSQEQHLFRFNPTIPIPIEVSKVHGIYDADIANEPAFNDKAKEIYQLFFNCDLAGYNSNKFDVPLLIEEFNRAGIAFEMYGRKLVDVQNIFHKMEKRTLAAAYKFYCDKDLINAHSALADTTATFEVLMQQLDKYTDLQPSVEFLSEFSTMHRAVDLAARIVMNEQNKEVFNFGKYKGKTVAAVFKSDPSYYDWMMKGDFATDTKNVITRLRLQELNNKLS